MSVSSHFPFAASFLRRAWWSMVCTFCGWATMVMYVLAIHSVYASESPNWFRMPMVFAMASIPYIAGVWLLVVLPLFYLFPHRSRVWVWYITPPLLALIGFAVMSVMVKLNFNPTTNRIIRLAALTGFATGVACVIQQRRQCRRIQKSEA